MTKTSKKDAIGRELEQILREDSEGRLRADAVVAFAQNPETALHSRFPWDDAAAARLKRLDIARGIIRVYRIVLDEKQPEEFRAYVSLTSDRKRPGGGYRPAMEVLSDDEMRKQLLRDAFQTMKRFMAKYSALQELTGVFGEMDRAIKSQKPEKEAG